MKITRNETIKELGIKTTGKFPEKEREKIVEAIHKIHFNDSISYSQKNAIESALTKELGDDYSNQSSDCKIFGETEHSLDLYNCKLKIAIEVEKTKTTTLLLDVLKFFVGCKNRKIDYGVLIFPDKYRTERKPDGHGDRFYNRIINELRFIEKLDFEIEDILVVEYDTGCLFK